MQYNYNALKIGLVLLSFGLGTHIDTGVLKNCSQHCIDLLRLYGRKHPRWPLVRQSVATTKDQERREEFSGNAAGEHETRYDLPPAVYPRLRVALPKESACRDYMCRVVL